MGNDRLRALVWDLRADDRRLLECRIVDGWPYTEIAAHLAVSSDVLVDRVRRLQTDLRRRAKALGVGKVKLNLAALMIV
jgi:DNA-directed RNA polymerase specialized sigma24 family protein